jgi:hypothetical protein
MSKPGRRFRHREEKRFSGGTVKFLILIYRDGPPGPPGRGAARAHASLVEDLTESGEMVLAESVAEQARRVLMSPDGVVLTAASPADSGLRLTRLYLIECDAIGQAVRHAARTPEAAAAEGVVEVRPILAFTGPDL